ncbi:MAG: alpha/beta hydrolase [Candidatus Gracilibacteria bacterium]|nr:alpha/beta hydrolase [Candidatus Gracilibacteria bacterium]
MYENKTNLEIKYKDFLDNNNSETIVILHGWGGSSDSWIEVGELLKNSGFNVIIPDLPGFGETKLNYVFDIEEYSKVVINFLRELKINNFILWGHSNGGAISIKIANSHIFNIKKLILNNSAGIRNDKQRNTKKIFFSIIIKPFKIFGKIGFLKGFRSIFYKIIGGYDYIRSEETPFLKETYLNIINADLKEDIKKIDIDTLLIRGEKDTYTPIRDAYFMRENIKKSKLIILDNETHGIHIKNPIRLVDTFLKNI